MDEIAFVKMHGLGNDFVVIDARKSPGRFAAPIATIQRIADRRLGVGCDQLIVIEPPRADIADAYMRILNSDGSEVGACGNASRCVAHMLMQEKRSPHVVLETRAGLLDAEAAGDGQISVDMGQAKLDWRDIPLARPHDTLHLPVEVGSLADPVAVNMGNPHAVFFVDAADAVDLAAVGPIVERHGLFPERTNIEIVQVLSRTRVRMRVWERGVGITLACGSGACAVAVAGHRRGLTDRRIEAALDGGVLTVEWLKDGHVLMTGPIAVSFTGTLAPDLVH
jgi:diaminopimelate epimerase